MLVDTAVEEVLRAIENQPQGARFHRADLHIHSFGGSHDVRDETMTPEAVVETARREGLDAIAITDHNDIRNVGVAIEAAASVGVWVVPGVELSTSQGHLLAYAPTHNALERFFGRLDIAGQGTSDSRCQTSMLDCLRLLEDEGGIGVLAHVDSGSGLEQVVPGYGKHKEDILAARSLLGFEVREASSSVLYSDRDGDEGRRRLALKRQELLGLGPDRYLARVLFSDSHSLGALGKNAAGDRRITRLKMDSPSFEGLRLALRDGGARVRLEDQIPQSVPWIDGARLRGGFLDGVVLRLNRNLTCFIGGRGAGKSTAFETIRCVAADSTNPLVDSDAWPDSLDVLVRDEAGDAVLFARQKSEEVRASGPFDQFPVECYGQGETAETSRRSRRDPLALIEYLDKFTNVDGLLHEEQLVRDGLLANQGDIEKAVSQIALRPRFKSQLATTRASLKALERAKGAEVIALERRLSSERSVRQDISDAVSDVQEVMESTALEDGLGQIEQAAEDKELEAGQQHFLRITKACRDLKAGVDAPRREMRRAIAAFGGRVSSELADWEAAEKGILEKIEAKREALAKQGVRLDMAYIKKLASDEAECRKHLATIDRWEKTLRRLKEDRQVQLEERRRLRREVAKRRTAFARTASEHLKGTLGELQVSVKVDVGAYSPDAENFITERMGWRTSQVERARALVRQMTVPSLLACIAKKNEAPVRDLTSDDGRPLFSGRDVRALFQALGSPECGFFLERCEVQDAPSITVTKKIGKRYIPRDFSRLSLGQQQSVLLALMLSSDSTRPLLIDQPGDNLDGEFIYQSLVPALRRVKERRQVILVTHNANIAVLGDADQIIALKSLSDRGQVVGAGSIDSDEARTLACQILEGSDVAFRRRGEMYGVL